MNTLSISEFSRQGTGVSFGLVDKGGLTLINKSYKAGGNKPPTFTLERTKVSEGLSTFQFRSGVSAVLSEMTKGQEVIVSKYSPGINPKPLESYKLTCVTPYPEKLSTDRQKLSRVIESGADESGILAAIKEISGCEDATVGLAKIILKTWRG